MEKKKLEQDEQNLRGLVYAIKLHLSDSIDELRLKNPDLKQVEHNLFEIGEHLGLNAEQIFEK